MGTGDDKEIAVEATLADALDRVAQAVRAYVAGPTEASRAEMIVELGHLDEVVARADRYEANSAGYAFALPGVEAVGEATAVDAVHDESPQAFNAQAALVRAAKREVRDATPDSLAELGVALAACRAADRASPE